MSGRRGGVVPTPERGDIVFTNFTPHAGHEMAGQHPCIVLSEQKFPNCGERRTGSGSMKASDGKSQTTRTPHDGKPYYCTTCGIGFAEYAACEELDCKLESFVEAHDRQTRKLMEDQHDR